MEKMTQFSFLIVLKFMDELFKGFIVEAGPPGEIKVRFIPAANGALIRIGV